MLLSIKLYFNPLVGLEIVLYVDSCVLSDRRLHNLVFVVDIKGCYHTLFRDWHRVDKIDREGCVIVKRANQREKILFQTVFVGSGIVHVVYGIVDFDNSGSLFVD
jgi:hypothetical protein